ncbi:MAG TPA: DUF1853 family protein [Cellvibrio sp.]|nr:DUF1853 family protein [Cellvibrio sp.]
MPNSINRSFQIRLRKLRHQAVRDLAWCCCSPPIMSEVPDTEAMILPFHDEQLWPWLMEIDQQPQALIALIATVKSTRLGIYYETLWRFYFSQRPEWELLQHNLQVTRDGITLGAFDFLCRRGNEYWHIETAVKFYLCDAQSSQDAREWHRWVGPSNLDRLDLKLSHLRQHQLPLHERTEAKLQLQMSYPTALSWKTGLCLQGYLFSPAGENYSPAFSHAIHSRGCWWHLKDFIAYVRQYSHLQWIILDRCYWLSPAQIDDSCELFSGENLSRQLREAIGKLQRPILLAAMMEDSGAKYWVEEWRGFVVPDNWPANSPEN